MENTFEIFKLYIQVLMVAWRLDHLKYEILDQTDYQNVVSEIYSYG